MNASFRRFEMLLPRRYNDGQEVPDKIISDTLVELQEQFGAVSCESQYIRGTWAHEDHVYRDDLIRVFVDTPDLPQSKEYFKAFKERMKIRFKQIDIWVTTYQIDVM